MAVRILSLIAKLGMDGSGFQQGLGKADSEMSRFASSLKSKLGSAFGVAAITGFLKSAISTAANIKDMAEQFSITTDEVQRLEAAAEKSGMEFTDMGNAVSKLNTLRNKALNNDKDAIASAKKLKLTMDDLLNAESGVGLLEKIGTAIKDIKLDPETAAALKEIFGEKKGERIAQALRDLTETKTAPIFGKETISVLDQLELKSVRLWRNVKSAAADAVAGWATVFGMKPQLDAKENKLFSFTGMSEADIKNMVQGAKEMNQASDKMHGGATVHDAPNKRGWIRNEGVTEEDAEKFVENANLIKEAEAELQRRANMKLTQKPDLEKLKAEAAVSQQEAEKLLALRDRLFQTNLKFMQSEERRMAIARRIREIEDRAKGLIGPERESDILKRQENLADLRAQLAGEFMKQKGQLPQFQLTPFEQLGASSGLTPGRSLALSQGTNSEDKEIVRATQRSAQLLQSIDNKVKPPGAAKSLFGQ